MNSTQIKHPQDPKTPDILSASNAILALWEKAADRLTVDELVWFSNLSVFIPAEINQLSEDIGRIASDMCMREYLETGQDSNDPCLELFYLIPKLDMINALLKVSAEAEKYLERQTSDQAKHSGTYPKSQA